MLLSCSTHIVVVRLMPLGLVVVAGIEEVASIPGRDCCNADHSVLALATVICIVDVTNMCRRCVYVCPMYHLYVQVQSITPIGRSGCWTQMTLSPAYVTRCAPLFTNTVIRNGCCACAVAMNVCT